MQLNWKRLLEQSVIVRIVDSSQKFLDSFAAINLQRLLSSLGLRRPLQTKQQRCQSDAMIEMQMANPDGVEVGPIEILFRHPMRSVSTASGSDRIGSVSVPQGTDTTARVSKPASRWRLPPPSKLLILARS